jgi:hypothetical protein
MAARRRAAREPAQHPHEALGDLPVGTFGRTFFERAEYAVPVLDPRYAAHGDVPDWYRPSA